MTIDLDELERKARADAQALDGLHGDPSKRGGWIGHRDHALSVVALVARIRELELRCAQAFVAGYDAGWESTGEGKNAEYTSKRYTQERYEDERAEALAAFEKGVSP